MKVFITHYNKLIERKQHILNQFNKNNITNYEFIEYFDKDLLNNDELNQFNKNLKKGSISLMLKHLYIYKEIAEKYDCLLYTSDAADE